MEAARVAPSLTEVRLLAVCLVAFVGFMRWDELIRLKCEDITFNAESMVIRIVSSKTDQYREGSSLVINFSSYGLCGVCDAACTIDLNQIDGWEGVGTSHAVAAWGGSTCE